MTPGIRRTTESMTTAADSCRNTSSAQGRPQSTIASRLNLTPEHFSRILHELSEAGLIRVEGRTVHIPDVGNLQKYGFGG